MKTENLTWFRRKVQKGEKLGRKIGFPTLNFRVGNFGQFYNDGVYSCEVKTDNQLYKGALHFGPKLGHPKKVLEIYVLDFNKNIYGQFIQFRVFKKIRNLKTFENLEELKKQIQKDLLSLKSF